jgi:hypothetical protein
MEKKFRRAERKIEKLTIRYPKLLKQDTINDTIEITTQAVKVDTIFNTTDGDTVAIFKDRLRIQYIVKMIRYISAELARLTRFIKLYLFLLSKSW